MANEITLSAALACTKSGATASGSHTATLTMAGDEFMMSVQGINHADAEALNLGDVTTVGYVLVKNLDATNYVELALDEPMANKFAKILAGGCALIPPSSATIYAQANTASVNVQIVAVEL